MGFGFGTSIGLWFFALGRCGHLGVLFICGYHGLGLIFVGNRWLHTSLCVALPWGSWLFRVGNIHISYYSHQCLKMEMRAASSRSYAPCVPLLFLIFDFDSSILTHRHPKKKEKKASQDIETHLSIPSPSLGRPGVCSRVILILALYSSMMIGYGNMFLS